MKRPRLPDELVEFFEEKKEHPNQNLGEIMIEEFPELEEEIEDDSGSLFEDKTGEEDLFDGDLFR